MMLIRTPWWYIVAVDHNEVGRRALVQVLALRAWQLKHGGQFPQTLDALVPEELPSLPNDPYSGRPFGYVPSHGLEVPVLRDALHAGAVKPEVPPPGVGCSTASEPTVVTTRGLTTKDKVLRSEPLDIVFAIPPVEGDAAGSKGQDQGNDAVKDRPAPAVRPSPPGSAPKE